MYDQSVVNLLANLLMTPAMQLDNQCIFHVYKSDFDLAYGTVGLFQGIESTLDPHANRLRA